FTGLVDKGFNSYDPDTIYVTGGITVRLTKDHGTTWINRSSNLPGTGGIEDIAVDPRARDTVFVVRSTSDGMQIFRSADAGQFWVNISNGLPNVPAWKVVID